MIEASSGFNYCTAELEWAVTVSQMALDSPSVPVVFGCFPCCSSRMSRFTSAGTTTRSMKPCTSGHISLALASALRVLSAGISMSSIRFANRFTKRNEVF